MNPVQTFFAGISPQHTTALAAALLLPVLLWVFRRLSPLPARPAAASLVDRWAAALLLVAAAVHLALPLGHRAGPLLTIGFLGSGAAYAALALRARQGRSWRLLAGLLVAATLVAYLSVVGTGAEEADQVGIATALAELTVLGLAMVPLRRSGPVPLRRRVARFAGSAGTVFAIVLAGAVVWVGSFLAHRAAGGQPELTSAATPAVGHSHEQGHDHAARAQAGVIMRPGGADRHPTAGQVRAADELAAATRQAMGRYADLSAALAAGYRLPGVRASGMDVHLEHKAYQADGRVLDPERPEMLVYAIGGGRATLLGVVFVMDVAGRPGPAPGGPITRWHAHNICVSVLPPGLGIVSPYGGCPAFSANLTSTEMMHVWVVDAPPGGPFAEALDEKWARQYHAEHGRAR